MEKIYIRPFICGTEKTDAIVFPASGFSLAYAFCAQLKRFPDTGTTTTPVFICILTIQQWIRPHVSTPDSSICGACGSLPELTPC